MTDFRIVYNDRTRLYRVEKRGWWGWSCALDEQGQDYATLASYEEARRFACRKGFQRDRSLRRWTVVNPCNQPCGEPEAVGPAEQ